MKAVLLAAAAAALALAVDVYYVLMLRSDPADELFTPVPIVFASAIGLSAVALLIPWQRAWLAAGAAVVLSACAYVSGFSIGLFLVPSVVLALLASARA